MSLSALIQSVSSLTERMERLVRQTQRMRLEIEDDPTRHLRPCAVCKLNETRFGICASCAEKQNGDPNG